MAAGETRKRMGRTDEEVATARSMSVASSQSMATTPPQGVVKVMVSSPIGDKGEKTCEEKDTS